jgi:hypothetical protein
MRKVIAYVNLTLDGHLAGPAGELDWTKLYPTAIGAGQPMFTGRRELRLVESKAWESGILTLRHLPRDPQRTKEKAFLAGPEHRRERPCPPTTTQPKRPEM